jgi:hypothetical protein
MTGKLSCAGSKRFGGSAGLPRHTDSQALTVEFVDDTQPPERPAIAGAVSDEVRLWLNDGSCIRLRPERPHHVWSYVGEYSDGSQREIEVTSVAQLGSRFLLRNSRIKLHLQQWNRLDRRARATRSPNLNSIKRGSQRVE